LRRSRLIGLLLCFCVVLGAASVAGAAERPREPFFPHSGNVGYDALRYDVDLDYRPEQRQLIGFTEIRAQALQRLSRFSLDLVGLRVDGVQIYSEEAGFHRGRDKLIVEPATPIAKGSRFSVFVSYRGHPRRLIDSDGSSEGWYPTDDGALAVGEPLGPAAWLPSNNVPADKARFEVRVTVPDRLKAVANGILTGVERRDGRATYSWREAKPMSTYLAVVNIGRGRLLREEIAGLPSWTLVDPRMAEQAAPVLAKLGETIRFLSGAFGPYPFESAGSLVDHAPELGYALETQSRPIYAFVPDITTLVHETAHQWFGDSVGLRRWPNIWLNEGFATWAQWYYAEHHGGRSARAIFNRLYRLPASKTEIWEPPSGHPGGPENLFAQSTYVRGAMALEALRIKVGTKPMLKTLRRWATANRYGSADIEDFIALAEQISGENLGPLFQRWLYQRGKP
jgi:aminopeptidase N